MSDPTAPTGAALYHGLVTHRRFRPKDHRLRYRVFSLLVDLDVLDRLDRDNRLFAHNRFGVFSFHDADHGTGEGGGLRPYVEGQLARAGIDLGGGAIHLLCYPRILGHVFNPLSVYYCRDARGRMRAILYEVTNTFKQRHTYLIPVDGEEAGDGVVRQSARKVFYVSPFMEMDRVYHFRMAPPGERVSMGIRETDPEGETVLTATFSGQAEPLSDGALWRAFLRYPLMSLKVVGGIHWEALKLWLKGLRLVDRPPPPRENVSVVTEKYRAGRGPSPVMARIEGQTPKQATR